MLHYLMILQRETGLLLFSEKISKEFKKLQPELISGLMTALNEFSKMMRIGELSTFISHNFKVVISAKEEISVILVIDLEDNETLWKSCAVEVVSTFRKQYNLKKIAPIESSYFNDFNQTLAKILQKYSWKIVIDQKISLDNVSLLLFFDLRDFTYYRFYSNNSVAKSDDEVLIEKTLEITTTETPEVKTTEGGAILYLIQEGTFGAVLMLTEQAREKDYLRIQRTVAFIVKHFSKRFSLNQQLEKAAISIFGEETIREFSLYDGKSISEIFRDAVEPIRILENIRRLMLRGLLVLME